MTDDWREHARRGEWHLIFPSQLSDAEKDELKEMLKHIVPTRKRGHGIETFEGFIPYQEAASETESEATLLVHRLERRRRNKAWDDVCGCLGERPTKDFRNWQPKNRTPGPKRVQGGSKTGAGKHLNLPFPAPEMDPI